MTDTLPPMIVQRQRDLLDVSETAAGRRFLARLLKDSRCLSSITAKSADVYSQTAVQDFGLTLWRELHRLNPQASAEIFVSIMSPPPAADAEKDTPYAR